MNDRSITSLKEHEIDTIAIHDQDAPGRNGRERFIFPEDSIDRNVTEKLFFLIAEAIGNERRYGRLLHDHEDVDYLIELLHHLLVTSGNGKLLHELAKHDAHSFYQSFDLFFLGAMAAKNLGYTRIREFSRKLLFRNCARLAVPCELLRKQRLASSEKRLFKEALQRGMETMQAMKVDPDTDSSEIPLSFMSNEHNRLLDIVRAYSALTLQNPLGVTLPSQLAIQFLFEQSLDKELLKKFANLLEIYPEGALVRLSDNSLAIVEDAVASTPALPYVRRLAEQPAQRATKVISHVTRASGTNIREHASGNTERNPSMTATLRLPLDFSLSIQEFIAYNSPLFSDPFEQFMEALVADDEAEAEQAAFMLGINRSLEDMFTAVYIPAFLLLEERMDGGLLVPDACEHACNLLGEFLSLPHEPHHLSEDRTLELADELQQTVRLLAANPGTADFLMNDLARLREKSPLPLSNDRKEILVIANEETRGKPACKLAVSLLMLEGHAVNLKDADALEFHELAFATSNGCTRLLMMIPEQLTSSTPGMARISQFCASMPGLAIANLSRSGFLRILKEMKKGNASFSDSIFHKLSH